MVKNNTLSVRFGNDIYTIISSPLYQWDHGITLRVFNAPNSVQQGHFSCADVNTSLNVGGSLQSGNVLLLKIPDALLSLGKPIFCYLYKSVGSSGYTVYTIKIPVIPRAQPTTTYYTEEETSSYNSLAAAFNVELDKLNAAMDDIDQAKEDVAEMQEQIQLLATKKELHDAIEESKIYVESDKKGTVTISSTLFAY